MNKLALLLFASGLLACGGGTKSDTIMAGVNPCGDPCAAKNPCGEGNPCGAKNPCGEGNPCGATSETSIDWTTYKSWTKIGDTFKSKHPGKPWATVYVHPDFADKYKALSGEMPEGMAVVKTIHKEVDGAAGDVKLITGMVKMGADYDPDNGNWYYAAISADGSKIKNQGKMEMCSNCHTSGKDYLFGTP